MVKDPAFCPDSEPDAAGYVYCPLCEKPEVRNSNMVNHVETAWTNPTFCGSCQLWYPSCYATHVHKRIEHQNGFKCPRSGCGRILKAESSLTRHIVSHDKAKKTCNICKIYSSDRDDNLDRHSKVCLRKQAGAARVKKAKKAARKQRKVARKTASEEKQEEMSQPPSPLPAPQASPPSDTLSDATAPPPPPPLPTVPLNLETICMQEVEDSNVQSAAWPTFNIEIIAAPSSAESLPMENVMPTVPMEQEPQPLPQQDALASLVGAAGLQDFTWDQPFEGCDI